MNGKLKYLIYALVIAAFCFVMAVTLLSARGKLSQVTCTGMEVSFKDSLEFVTADDVKGFVDKQYGSYIGQKLDSVGLSRIETLLEAKSAVLESEAWTTSDGILHISITQRAPAIRFQKGGIGFYADEEGFIFPLHRTYTAPVPFVSGNIPVTINSGFKGELESEDEKQWVLDVLELTRYLAKSRSLKGKIDGMQVNEEGDLVLTAAEGGERIVFGSPKDVAEKFARLDKYYTHILPAKGAGYYKTVNVKYNGQIICRKDI